MGPVELMDDIYWVGAIDWNIRDFHGYSTERGSTYNAYLVKDDRVTLFDTVKKGFVGDLWHHLHGVIEPEKIDYLVVNHVEMDHSDSLPEVVERIKPKKIFCSKMAAQALDQHFHPQGWPLEIVGTGDSISLGRRTVTFLETRMVHWPDSMFSYLPDQKLLISSDGFGQHWATSERFDDQVDTGRLMRQAAKYYANILLLYSPLIRKILKNVAEMNLAIDMIAPDHGLIWRKDPGSIISAYDSWSRQKTKPKALVIYDTMWHSTETMAKAIAGGIVEQGVSVKLMNLAVNNRSDVMTEVLDAQALVFGSATLNNQMLPRVADVLTYIKGLKPAGRIGAAFGSYGWSGEAVKHIEAQME
ncbi:MAG: flavodoxin domain-containing protein, partial [Proteobacteria bacterium]|nr:flavodoxin domain-containing protein [Pseudomonadota bacterium]